MKSPEGGKVAKRGFELVRWKREVAKAEESSVGDLVTYGTITQCYENARSSLFMSVCIFRWYISFKRMLAVLIDMREGKSSLFPPLFT